MNAYKQVSENAFSEVQGGLKMPLTIRPFGPADHTAWEALARGYQDFYSSPTTDAEYAATWERLLAQDGIYGLGASGDGQLLGIAHYFFHASVWAQKVCYLQDLFTAPGARGQGVGRNLIEAVATQARMHGATRYFWHTHEQNHVARSLYDKVAKHMGFIRYDYKLPPHANT